MESIDQLLALLPAERPETENPKQNSGLCLRYSVSRSKWIFAYGVKRNKASKGKIAKYDLKDADANYGIGSTPLEAGIDFVEKMKKYDKIYKKV